MLVLIFFLAALTPYGAANHIRGGQTQLAPEAQLAPHTKWLGHQGVDELLTLRQRTRAEPTLCWVQNSDECEVKHGIPNSVCDYRTTVPDVDNIPLEGLKCRVQADEPCENHSFCQSGLSCQDGYCADYVEPTIPPPLTGDGTLVSVFVWKEKLSANWDPGHASVWIDSVADAWPSVGDHDNYVSWWPKFATDLASTRPAMANDVCWDFGNEKPNFERVDIKGCLDVAAMKDFFAELKSHSFFQLCEQYIEKGHRNIPNAHCEYNAGHQVVVKASEANKETEKYSFYGEEHQRSCSSMAWQVLKAGGSDTHATHQPDKLKHAVTLGTTKLIKSLIRNQGADPEKSPWKPSDVLALAKALKAKCPGSKEHSFKKYPALEDCGAQEPLTNAEKREEKKEEKAAKKELKGL